MKPITLWALKTKVTNNGITEVIWNHNHIEDGHCVNNIPTIKFPEQNGWKGCTWKKEFAFLNEEYKVIHNNENI